MTSADHYRTEAKRCRDLAARAVAGSAMSDQWLKIAVEYDTLAEAMERSPLMPRAQQQPMQQQQSKAEPDK
jgi:hypothetical protein